MSSQPTERGHGTGPDLATALAAALAAVVNVEQDDVEVTLDLPAEVTFPSRINLELTVADGSAALDEAGTDEAGAAEPEPTPAPTPAPVARNRGGGGRPRAAAPTSDERQEAPDAARTPEELDEEADVAADFLEGLLDALDLPGDLRIKVHADHAEIEIVDIGNGALIGRRGQTLEAIQELVRCTLQRQFQRRSHIKVDAEGYRARRLEKLVEKTEEAIDQVLDSGESVRLEPMDVFERKTVHQMVAEVEGLASRSQGREPARRVVILKE